MNTSTKPRLLIFTDLDGTLLDHDTYDFAPALPALEAMRAAQVPLILCSSKTFAEMQYWCKALDINHPFISENGGALFVPKDYFVEPLGFASERDGHSLILTGVAYFKLRAALIEIAARTYLPLIGFGDLTVEQIAARTGLELEQARLAKMRDADEPFFINRDFGEDEVKRLHAEAWREGLRVTRGGRFFHLTGNSDKGTAAHQLIRLYQAAWQQPIRTVGLGDSLNDLPFLQAVDAPVLVRNKNGGVDQSVLVQVKAQITRQPGPAGWNEAILEILH
ncbi:HAD-IIB family hydrolase [candidate division KSB1 bacterium]|nr:HAD-IIB family hydrolase [candidate division KSB1 bacterium]